MAPVRSVMRPLTGLERDRALECVSYGNSLHKLQGFFPQDGPPTRWPYFPPRAVNSCSLGPRPITARLAESSFIYIRIQAYPRGS